MFRGLLSNVSMTAQMLFFTILYRTELPTERQVFSCSVDVFDGKDDAEHDLQCKYISDKLTDSQCMKTN